MASLKTRVTLVCTELVEELKFLQMLAMRRDAKSLGPDSIELI